MCDALLETPDLPLLLLQPPLQPRNLLPRHGKMERASQPRPQPGLAPGEVVVTLVSSHHRVLVTMVSDHRVLVTMVSVDLMLLVTIVSVHRMLVTRGLSSPQPLLSVTSPGESDHGSPQSLELGVIRALSVTGARDAGFITHSLDQQSSIIITGLKYLTHI